MTEAILKELGIEILSQQSGNQILCLCPQCKTRHLYINKDNGLWDCKKGCGQGNLFELVRNTMGFSNKRCFDFLKKHSKDVETTFKHSETPKDISWFTRQLSEPTESELDKFCQVKGIDKQALKCFFPKILRKDSIICLPAYEPSDMSICGYLRVHLEGKLIKLKDGREEKYPAIGNMGLFGLPYFAKVGSDQIILAEGWRDALAAIALGFTAIASSGGASTWKLHWTEVFEDKQVYIIMDRDRAGLNQQKKIASAIYKTAKHVRIVALPFEFQEKHGKDLYDFIYEGNFKDEN